MIMETKPFRSDLPVQTRDGKKATIVHTFKQGDRPYPILAIAGEGANENLICCTGGGHYQIGSPGHPSDLINIPVRHKLDVWVNVYPGRIGDCCHDTKEQANRIALNGRIACLKVVLDFQEGEGLL